MRMIRFQKIPHVGDFGETTLSVHGNDSRRPGCGLRSAIECPGFSMNNLAAALDSYLAEIR